MTEVTLIIARNAVPVEESKREERESDAESVGSPEASVRVIEHSSNCCSGWPIVADRFAGRCATIAETAEYAIRQALGLAAQPVRKQRFYAREETVIQNYLRWRPGLQTFATRATIPLVEWRRGRKGAWEKGRSGARADAMVSAYVSIVVVRSAGERF